jgi:hypothetical protein
MSVRQVLEVYMSMSVKQVLEGIYVYVSQTGA